MAIPIDLVSLPRHRLDELRLIARRLRQTRHLTFEEQFRYICVLEGAVHEALYPSPEYEGLWPLDPRD